MASALGSLAAALKAVSLEKIKLAIAILRDLIIAGLFILLLAFPAFVNDRLVNAGFEEGSLVGLKWKRRAVATDTQLKEATLQISTLRTRLDATQKALNDLERQAPSASRANLAQVQRENEEVARGSDAALVGIRRTISTNERAVAQASETLSDDARWAVIFGGDRTLEAAQHEMGRAQQAGIPASRIVHRQGSFRSVAILPTREAALAILVRARRLQADAYAVNLATWCPSLQEAGTHYTC